jgi:ribosomal protein L37AE/L43A
MSELTSKLKPEILAEQPIKLLNGLELVITPKKEFLEWFKSTKGIIGDIKVKPEENYKDSMECPNCKSKMDNYELNNDSNELWHLCSKCNLSFSQRQHKYFTTMIIMLIKESNSSESNES